MAVAFIFTGMPRHPKIRRAGERAGWLFVHMLDHCAEWKTDGYVSDADVTGFGLPGVKGRLTALANVTLIHRTDGGWTIHDYLDWNRPAVELAEAEAEKRRQKSEAGRKGAAVRWGGKVGSSANATAMADAMAERCQSDDPGSGSGSYGGSVDPLPLDAVPREAESGREDQQPNPCKHNPAKRREACMACAREAKAS